MIESKNGSVEKKEVLTDIQALVAVKESYSKDVRHLNEQRASVQNQLGSLEQELKATKQRIQAEEESWKQKREREYSSLDNRLKQKETNLGAKEAQLNNREGAIANLEEVKAEFEKRTNQLNAKSFDVERLRIGLQTQKDSADLLKARYESELSAFQQNTHELNAKITANKQESARLDELIGKLEKQEADLKLRTQTVEDATKGLKVKIREIDEREGAIKQAQAIQDAKELQFKQREEACEERERRQEQRHREQEAAQAKNHAEETKYRKRGLELADWEHRLIEDEKKLKVRERALKESEVVGKA